MPFRTGPATPRPWFRPLARGAVLCLLATLPAFAQSPPPQPDPQATQHLLAFQETAAHWLETLATASRGERGRVRLAVAQARFARAARTPGADTWLRRAADTARRGAYHPERVGALSVLSDEAYRRGDMAAVIAIENEALADARRYGDRREIGSSFYGLGMADMAEGRLDQAEARYREAIAIWREGKLERQIAFAERALGRVFETRGQYAEAVEMQVSALETMLRIGRPIEQSESYYTLAKLFFNLEDNEAALEGSNQSLSLIGETPPDFPLGLNLVLRANIRLKLGDHAAALADAEAAMAALRRTGGDLGPALASLSLGRAQFANGRREEGLATLREGRALAARLNERLLDSDLALAEGEALVAMGRPADALAPLQQAYAIGEALQLDRLRQDVSLEMEKAYSALGRTAEALDASKRAYAFRTKLSRFDQLGQLAAGNGSARARFMALEPGPAPEPEAPPVAAASTRTALPTWIWALALPTLLLAWGLVRVLRHTRRLRDEKRQIAARQQALETEHQALRERVALDPLTGALTRQAFATELSALLAHAENHGRSVALLVFDLDNFKTINDQHGHLAGDEALRLATGIARGKLRSDDLLGRFGGDEFLVACEGLDQAAAEALAEQLRFDLVWRAPDATPPMPGLSLSVGVAVADLGKGYDAGDLFHRADTALFRAKRAGRNRVVGDDPAHAGDADSRRARQWNDALAEP